MNKKPPTKDMQALLTLKDQNKLDYTNENPALQKQQMDRAISVARQSFLRKIQEPESHYESFLKQASSKR